MNPAFRQPGLRAAAIAVGAIVLLVVVSQLSALVFLAIIGAPMTGATPLTMIQYAAFFGGSEEITNALWIAVAAGISLAASPALILFVPQKARPLHGDADWANRWDIRKAGLLDNRGIIVGKIGNDFIHHNGSGRVSPHAFLAAPTGSGKTQGVMFPNALSWAGSLVVTDIKGELYEHSARFREEAGQEVYVLDLCPTSRHGDQYNPFAYVDPAPEKVAAGVWKIAEYLVPESKPEGIWSTGGRQIIAACALYYYGLDQVPTLPMIRQLIYTPEGFIAWCRDFMSKSENIEKHHPEAVNGFGSVASNPVNTVGGFITTAQQALSPLSNDLACAVLSGNTFDLRELRRKPMTIYVVIRPVDRDQFAPIARLFFQQLIDINSRTEFSQLPPDSHEVLLGMDEFATLGKLPAIANGITVIRSYGIRLLVIVQSPTQLISLYGREDGKTFTDNFGCTVFYTPGARDMETAEELSKLLGNKTVRGRSESRRKYGVLETNAQITSSDQRRPLMLPQEVMTMDGDSSIIRISGCKPIRGKKILAATDDVFRHRMLKPLQRPALPVQASWQRPKRKQGVPKLADELIAPPAQLATNGQAVEVGASPHERSANVSTNQREQDPRSPEPAMETVMREPTEIDIQNLSSASMEDFDLNFNDVDLPKKIKSPKKLQACVDKILTLYKKR